MNYFKWHKWSAVLMMISGAICLWSGHKMVSKPKQSKQNGEE